MRCDRCVTERQCRSRGHIVALDKGGFAFREGVTPGDQSMPARTGEPPRYANTQDRIAGITIEERARRDADPGDARAIGEIQARRALDQSDQSDAYRVMARAAMQSPRYANSHPIGGVMRVVSTPYGPAPAPPAPWENQLAELEGLRREAKREAQEANRRAWDREIRRAPANAPTLITNETFARSLFAADPDVQAFVTLRGEDKPGTPRYAKALGIAWERNEKGWRTRFVDQAERTGKEFRAMTGDNAMAVPR